MDVALKVLREKGIAIEDKGTLICDLDAYKLGRTVIRKNDGTNLYITRDIGEAIQRYEKYQFDKMIYVVASQQDLHLAQFFKVLDLMGFHWAKKLQHINFGMVAGMSTRKGTSVHLEDMMNEARNTMHEQMKTNVDKYNEIPDPLRTADEVGISGIKIQDMAGKRYSQLTAPLLLFNSLLTLIFSESSHAELMAMNSNGIVCCHSRETQAHTSNVSKT
jgi:arginyl-tRNA synthetase